MKTVHYTGYTYSGGIVGGLILRELRNFVGPFPPKKEFRLLKERFGLCDLAEAVTGGYDPEIIDLALKDFLWLSSKFARRNSFFKPTGFGYDDLTNGQFSRLTHNFIEGLTETRYPMDWHFYDFRSTFPRVMKNRVLRRLSGNNTIGLQEALFCAVTREEFAALARTYLSDLSRAFAPTDYNFKESDVLAYSKAIPPYSCRRVEQCLEFFADSKMVIVDRDPRDIYAELNRSGKQRYLASSDHPEVVAESFCKFYLSMRREKREISMMRNVLTLQFETLCLNYETELQNIYSFLGIEGRDHIRKRECFDPNISVKNIGIWKSMDSKGIKVAEIIARKLSDFSDVSGIV